MTAPAPLEGRRDHVGEPVNRNWRRPFDALLVYFCHGMTRHAQSGASEHFPREVYWEDSGVDVAFLLAEFAVKNWVGKIVRED